MGWSLYLKSGECPSCHRTEDLGAWSCTYNLNSMLRGAGLDDIRALRGQKGEQIAATLRPVLATLRAEPERFRAMNPSNGWGDYDGLVPVIAEIVEACEKNPSAVMGGWF